MNQLGDIYWKQLSQWNFSPKNCIESYINRNGHIFHYVLVKVVEIISPTQIKTDYEISIEDISDDILKSENRKVYIKQNGKSIEYTK